MKPYFQAGDPQMDLNTTAEVLPKDQQVLSPNQFLSLGVQHAEDEHPEYLVLKASGFLLSEEPEETDLHS